MFPTDNLEPRALENRPGCPFDADKLAWLYAEDVLDIANHVVAIEKLMQGFDGFMLNGQIVPSISNNDLVVALKTKAGDDPSAEDPVAVMIAGTLRVITSALSVTLADGTNWFNSGGAELATRGIDYFVYLGYNATDGVVIGFARVPYVYKYSLFSTTNTAQNYCAISTITNAAATDPYVVIGRFEAVLSAGAGYTWTIPAGPLIINRPIFETRWMTFIPVLNTLATLSGYTSARYKLSMDTCIVSFDASDVSMSGAGANFNVKCPFTGLGGLVGVAYVEQHTGCTAVTQAYFGPAAGRFYLYKSYPGGAWLGTEVHIYLGFTAVYPIV